MARGAEDRIPGWESMGVVGVVVGLMIVMDTCIVSTVKKRNIG